MYNSIKIIVPRKLIKKIQEGPEVYGGDIAILINGMWTDVLKAYTIQLQIMMH